MATEFDDSQHYGIFVTGATLTSQTGKMVRESELVLSALRAQGVFDIMEDGTTAPTVDKLWLDKNTDPAVLKEWDSVSSTWQAMTFDRLFGRATVTDLVNLGGTANAITCDEPSPFTDGKIYGIVPLAGNTGATTIQVSGVGTYDVVYPDGSAIAAGELSANLRTPLLFANGRFEVLFGSSAGTVKIANKGQDIPLEAAFGGAAAIIRNAGEKLNLDLPSTADLGHSPDATASYNDGALQAAIDAMLAEPDGGGLNIPRDIFNHSAQITIPKGNPIILQGAGHGTKLLFTATAGLNAFYLGDETGGGCDIHLRDFSIYADTDTYVSGMYLRKANIARIERVFFNNLKACILSDNSYGLRIYDNRALSIADDFFKTAGGGTHGSVFFGNGYFTSTGYLANFADGSSNINNTFIGNDSEVVAGILKNASGSILYALTYDGNYMEQASGNIFDFSDAVYGSINRNTFQSSTSNAIANFTGPFDGNLLYNQTITWASSSKPQIGYANKVTGTGSLGQSNKTFTPTVIGTATAGTGTYTTQSGTYTQIQNRILFDLVVTWSAHTGTGNIAINTDLPAPNGNTTAVIIRVDSLTYSGDLVGAINPSSQIIINSQATGAALANVAIDTAATITVSGQYRTAA